MIRGVLEGARVAGARSIVLANAAAALLAAERVRTLLEGVERATTQAVMEGRAAAVLEGLVRESRP